MATPFSCRLIHIINYNNLWIYSGANNQYWWCKVVKLRSSYEWTNDKQAIFTTKEDTEPLDLSLLNRSRKITDKKFMSASGIKLKIAPFFF